MDIKRLLRVIIRKLPHGFVWLRNDGQTCMLDLRATVILRDADVNLRVAIVKPKPRRSHLEVAAKPSDTALLD